MRSLARVLAVLAGFHVATSGGGATAAADPPAAAADPPAAAAGQPARMLVVGTKHSPPFAIAAPDGTWTGLSVELWKLVASDMGQRYVIRPFEHVQGLLDAVERRELDLAIGALTITPEREAVLDFAEPFYRTGLAIAARPRDRAVTPGEVTRGLLVWQLGAALGVLALFAALLAALVRRAERRRQGTSGSLRWAAGGAWVLAAILLVSGFAVWSATTTVARKLAEDIRGPDDLPHVPVATVPGSTSAEYLKARDIEPRPVATPLDALRALVAGEIDAVVYDAPILKHIILSEGLVGKAVVLPGLFDPQDYAFALPDGSAIRTELNRHLVVRLQGDTWRRRLSQDLGEDR